MVYFLTVKSPRAIYNCNLTPTFFSFAFILFFFNQLYLIFVVIIVYGICIPNIAHKSHTCGLWLLHFDKVPIKKAPHVGVSVFLFHPDKTETRQLNQERMGLFLSAIPGLTFCSLVACCLSWGFFFSCKWEVFHNRHILFIFSAWCSPADARLPYKESSLIWLERKKFTKPCISLRCSH